MRALLALLATFPAATFACSWWCNAYTCGDLFTSFCGTCDQCSDLQYGEHCAPWCNAWTCSIGSGLCDGCNVCDRVAYNVHCEPWCNSFTCAIGMCSGCIACGGQGPNHNVNMCGYNNSRGEAFFINQVAAGGCSTLVDSSLDTGTEYTQASNASNGPPVLTRTCSQGLFMGTAAELRYAAFCPEACVDNPSCSSTKDNSAFMIEAFGSGNPAFTCAAYAGAGFCLQSTAPNQLPPWWEAMMAIVCPDSCGYFVAGRRTLDEAADVESVYWHTAPEGSKTKLTTTAQFKMIGKS